MFLFQAFNVSADDCIAVPKPLAQEITNHLEKIRAGEYCPATILQTNEKQLSLYLQLKVHVLTK